MSSFQGFEYDALSLDISFKNTSRSYFSLTIEDAQEGIRWQTNDNERAFIVTKAIDKALKNLMGPDYTGYNNYTIDFDSFRINTTCDVVFKKLR